MQNPKPASTPSTDSNALPHGPWLIHQRRDVYQDAWIHLTRDEVTRPDGKPGHHSILKLKPGVCVIAMDDQDHLYLTEEFHYAVGRVTLEGVSGGIEAGEDPLQAAGRELEEEIGLRAAHWTDLGSCDPFTAIVNSPTRLYLARELTFVPDAPEGTERIRRVRMAWPLALAAVQDSTISHAPTALAIMKAYYLLGMS